VQKKGVEKNRKWRKEKRMWEKVMEALDNNFRELVQREEL
jgi:hypothetical protein